jgi:hypothetical protein
LLRKALAFHVVAAPAEQRLDDPALRFEVHALDECAIALERPPQCDLRRRH